MADIQLRFNRDMLVLSSPVRTQLSRLGLNVDRDMEMMLLLEPEALDELYALDVAVGVQCLVADTSAITPARLTHLKLGAQSKLIAESAINAAADANPQHVLAEINPSGLPLDPSSKSSLVENRDQFTRAVNNFIDVEPLFDAYFLNNFTDVSEIKCALIGMRKVTDKPIFVSVCIDDSTIQTGDIRLSGASSATLEAAVDAAFEYGAQVFGFETAANSHLAAQIAHAVKEQNGVMPILAQLKIGSVDPEQAVPTLENPYFEPDTMVDAADLLKAAGVQFVRATGNATPVYAGALVASTIGDEVVLEPESESFSAVALPPDDLAALGEDLYTRVSAALNKDK